MGWPVAPTCRSRASSSPSARRSCSWSRSRRSAALWSRAAPGAHPRAPAAAAPARGRGRARRARRVRRSASPSTPGSPAPTREREPRADGGLRRLLGRRAVRLAAVRRRLAAAQPVAGDRARDRAGWPSASAATSCRSRCRTRSASASWPAAAGDLRLRGLRAVLGDGHRAGAAGDHHAASTSSSMLVGMSIYGVEPWTRNADGFGVLFGADRLARRRSARRDGRARRARRRSSAPPRLRAGRRDDRACCSSRSARRRSTAPRRAPLFNDLRQATCRTSSRDSGCRIGRGARARLRASGWWARSRSCR